MLLEFCLWIPTEIMNSLLIEYVVFSKRRLQNMVTLQFLILELINAFNVCKSCVKIKDELNRLHI